MDGVVVGETSTGGEHQPQSYAECGGELGEHWCTVSRSECGRIEYVQLRYLPCTVCGCEP
jgi:hypothetical protein